MTLGGVDESDVKVLGGDKDDIGPRRDLVSGLGEVRNERGKR